MTAARPALPKPYPYETPRITCHEHGCESEPTKFARLRTGKDARFCEAHAAAQTARVISEQLGELCNRFPRMDTWTLRSWPADDVAGRRAKNIALEWLKDLSSTAPLYVHGPVGSGKTGLAWSLLVALIENGSGYDRADFVNVRQLLTRMRRSFGTDDPYDPIDDLTRVWNLVLDDLGSERVRDWTREWLATLIEARYVREKPLIVTSNYSPSQLARRLGHDDPMIGKRIVSRLVEDGVVIELNRPDLRVRKAA